MKKLSASIPFIVCTVAAICLNACGYKFEGGGYINGDVRSVAVEIFKNNSSESSAGISFTNALKNEIIQKTSTQVVDETGGDTTLTGAVNAISFSVLSRSSSENVVERRMTASVDAKLTDSAGSVLWSIRNFSWSEDYRVSEDSIADESSKRQAVEVLAQRTAEKLVSKMVNRF